MPAAIITLAELREYGARSVDMTQFTDAQVNEYIDRAVDRIRNAALNDYDAVSFETLTAANAPDELRDIALALALGSATRGDASRPQSVTDAEADAAMRIAFIAGGKSHFDAGPGAVLVKSTSGPGVSYRGPTERVFDRDNVSQLYSNRNPTI